MVSGCFLIKISIFLVPAVLEVFFVRSIVEDRLSCVVVPLVWRGIFSGRPGVSP